MDGLLQRQFFYSMTGKTGGCKTAIALFIAAMVALGKTVDGREYTKGRVLYLPAKIRSIFSSDGSPWPSNTILRPIRLGLLHLGRVHRFGNGRNDQKASRKRWARCAGGHDTTAAYFEGDDENNNVQAGRYARMQRGLVNLPGGPTVFSSMPPGQRGGGR